jgi:hypothetical protein
MKNKHGADKSRVMCAALYKINFDARVAGVEMWEFVDYNIIPNDCENQEYKDLLNLWGINADADPITMAERAAAHERAARH